MNNRANDSSNLPKSQPVDPLSFRPPSDQSTASSADPQRPRRRHHHRRSRNPSSVDPYGQWATSTFPGMMYPHPQVFESNGQFYALVAPISTIPGHMTPSLASDYYYQQQPQSPRHRRRPGRVSRRSQPPSDMIQTIEREESIQSVDPIKVEVTKRQTCVSFNQEFLLFTTNNGKIVVKRNYRRYAVDLTGHFGPVDRRLLPVHRLLKICRSHSDQLQEANGDQEDMKLLWDLVHDFLSKSVHIDRAVKFKLPFDLWSVLTRQLKIDDLIDFDGSNRTEGAEKYQASGSQEQSNLLCIVASSDSLFVGANSAMHFAQEHSDWSQALFLSLFSNSSSDQIRLLHSYIDWLGKQVISPSNRALITFYELLLSKVPSTLNNSEYMIDGQWRKHLAIVLSLRDQRNPNLISASISTLKSTLTQMKRHIAVEICDLLFDGSLPSSGLLGCNKDVSNFGIRELLFDQKGTISLLSSILDCIQLTEIYEDVIERWIPSLFKFKVLLAHALAEVGHYDRAWKYCEAIAQNFVEEENVHDQITVCSLVVDLSYRLTQHLPEFQYGIFQLPAWLVSLQQRMFNLVRCPCAESHRHNPEMDLRFVQECERQESSFKSTEQLNAPRNETQSIDDYQISEQNVDKTEDSEILDEQHEHSFPAYEPSIVPKEEEVFQSLEVESCHDLAHQNLGMEPTLIASEPIPSALPPRPLTPRQAFYPLVNDCNQSPDIEKLNDAMAKMSMNSPNVGGQNETSKSNRSSPEPVKGLFSLFSGILRPQSKTKQIPVAILPDDSEKKLFYCERRKRWVNTDEHDESNDQSDAQLQPPPILLTGEVPLERRMGYKTGGRSGHVSAWSQMNATVRVTEDEDLFVKQLLNKNPHPTQPQGKFFVPQ